MKMDQVLLMFILTFREHVWNLPSFCWKTQQWSRKLEKACGICPVLVETQRYFSRKQATINKVLAAIGKDRQKIQICIAAVGLGTCCIYGLLK